MEYKIKLTNDYDFPLKWGWEVYPILGLHWDSFGFTITKRGAARAAKRAIRKYENRKRNKPTNIFYTYGD